MGVLIGRRLRAEHPSLSVDTFLSAFCVGCGLKTEDTPSGVAHQDRLRLGSDLSIYLHSKLRKDLPEPLRLSAATAMGLKSGAQYRVQFPDVDFNRIIEGVKRTKDPLESQPSDKELQGAIASYMTIYLSRESTPPRASPRDSGLFDAIRAGNNTEARKCLGDDSVNLLAVDDDGDSAIVLALKHGNTDILSALFKHAKKSGVLAKIPSSVYTTKVRRMIGVERDGYSEEEFLKIVYGFFYCDRFAMIDIMVKARDKAHPMLFNYNDRRLTVSDGSSLDVHGTFTVFDGEYNSVQVSIVDMIIPSDKNVERGYLVSFDTKLGVSTLQNVLSIVGEHPRMSEAGLDVEKSLIGKKFAVFGPLDADPLLVR